MANNYKTQGEQACVFSQHLLPWDWLLSAPAQAAFPGKDITIVIPYGPYGGFDTLTRKLSPYIEEYFAKKSRKKL